MLRSLRDDPAAAEEFAAEQRERLRGVEGGEEYAAAEEIVDLGRGGGAEMSDGEEENEFGFEEEEEMEEEEEREDEVEEGDGEDD